MPLSLAQFLVEFMTEPNDLVVDPFGGSFTTALAAQMLGRRWIATEQVLDYVIGARSRFSQYLDQLRDKPRPSDLVA